MDYLVVASLILIGFYVLLILVYTIGWLSIKELKRDTNLPELIHKYSIIIPARNEAKYIKKCIEDIVSQHANKNNFEIIVIDDYSDDDTVKIVNQIIHENLQYAIKLIELSSLNDSNILSKKQAITYAISLSIHPYVILTDADCTRGNEWLISIDRFLTKNDCVMIYAPVLFSANNWFEKIQSLEFMGLVGIGASAIKLKNPNMCSAANLIFKREVFFEVNGYAGNLHIASGDDEYLLHKFFKKYPSKIAFLKDARAIVTTTANNSMRQLTEQRKRWVSKSLKYENRFITAILIAAYLFNASIVYHLIFNTHFGLKLLLLKTLTEGIFLMVVLKFFGRLKYLIYLPLAELFHIAYVIIIGVWANLSKYEWKNRKH